MRWLKRYDSNSKMLEVVRIGCQSCLHFVASCFGEARENFLFWLLGELDICCGVCCDQVMSLVPFSYYFVSQTLIFVPFRLRSNATVLCLAVSSTSTGGFGNKSHLMSCCITPRPPVHLRRPVAV